MSSTTAGLPTVPGAYRVPPRELAYLGVLAPPIGWGAAFIAGTFRGLLLALDHPGVAD